MIRSFALVLLLAGPTVAQPADAVLVAGVDSLLAGVAPDGPGCVVGIARGGATILLRAYGLANVEHGVPLTPETVFDVASLSKQITAYTLLRLERQGRLALDDDVRRHLPEVPDLGATVTVRQLVHHAGGVRAYEVLRMLDGWNRDRPLSRAEVEATVARMRGLSAPPGTVHDYGNTNYVLLAWIAERLTGQPFADVLRDHVFAPLGMTRSFLRDDLTAATSGLADTYTALPDGGVRRNRTWALAYASGAAHVVTTASDLLRWADHVSTARLGGASVDSLMGRRLRLAGGDTTAYAFGQEFVPYRGLTAWVHTGGGGGDYALVRVPAQRAAVAVLCNAEDGPGAYDLAFRVADLALAFPPAPWPEAPVAVAVPVAVLARYAGTWRDEATPTESLVLAVQPDGTLAFVYDGTATPLVASASDTFHAGPLRFAFGPVGGVEALTVTNGRRRFVLHRDTLAPWGPTPADRAAFAGTYRSDELDAEWTVRADGDTLALYRHAFPPRRLTPATRDVWVLTDPFDDLTLTLRLTVERGADGAVTGFRLSASRAANLAFHRLDGPLRPVPLPDR